jgi:threonine/homoserine/homoserine lactone efflux protein
VEHLLLAFTVGLGAGITPGPLQTLVVTTALQRGYAGGWRVAIGPLLTDAPIVALSIAVVSQLSESQLRGLAIVGGVVVILFGLREMWSARRPLPETEVAGSRDLWRGAIVNLTNPHPWVFWAGIGGPALVAAWRDSVAFGLGFLLIFYGLLIGSKLVLAAVVAVGKRRLEPSSRQRLLFIGGALLVVAGVILVLSRI